MVTTNTYYQLCLPIYCSKNSQIWEDVLDTMYLFPLYFVFVSLLHFQHLDIFYHQLPCICHQSIFVVVPSQSCARRRSSMHRTAFDLETARKVHLHHFLSRHHNLFFSNSDLLPHTINCSWQFSPSSTLLESSVFVFVAPCLSFRCVVKQCSDIWSHRLGER